MTPSQRDNVASAVYETLMSLRRSGKNDNMLKNAYIKFMCWLYYKFERIVILSEAIPPPTPEEINGINRKNYRDINGLIMDLSLNIQYAASQELQRIMVKAFVDLLLSENKNSGNNLTALPTRPSICFAG